MLDRRRAGSRGRALGAAGRTRTPTRSEALHRPAGRVARRGFRPAADPGAAEPIRRHLLPHPVHRAWVRWGSGARVPSEGPVGASLSAPSAPRMPFNVSGSVSMTVSGGMCDSPRLVDRNLTAPPASAPAQERVDQHPVQIRAPCVVAGEFRPLRPSAFERTLYQVLRSRPIAHQQPRGTQQRRAGFANQPVELVCASH